MPDVHSRSLAVARDASGPIPGPIVSTPTTSANPRAEAIAALSSTIANLAASGDLAGAQTLHAALGSLLANPTSDIVSVVDLNKRWAGR